MDTPVVASESTDVPEQLVGKPVAVRFCTRCGAGGDACYAFLVGGEGDSYAACGKYDSAG